MVYKHIKVLEVNGFTSHADVENNAEGSHIRQYGRPSVAEERQGNAGYRHNTHGHGNVFENLECEHSDDTGYHQRAVEIQSISNRCSHSVEQNAENGDDQQSAEESQFFANYGEDKVRRLYRNEIQFLLGAVEKTGTGKAAVADGYLRLPYLVVPTQVQIFRMEEGFDTFLLIWLQENEGYRNGTDYQSHKLGENFQVDACKENHSDPDCGKYQRTSQVLFEDDDDNRCCHDAGFDQAFEIIQAFTVFVQVTCQNQNVKNLYKFGRLDGGKPQIDPGSCTELFDAKRRINGQQQEERCNIEMLLQTLKDIIVLCQNDDDADGAQHIGCGLYNHFSADAFPKMGTADGQNADRCQSDDTGDHNLVNIFRQIRKIVHSFPFLFLTLGCHEHYNIICVNISSFNYVMHIFFKDHLKIQTN